MSKPYNRRFFVLVGLYFFACMSFAWAGLMALDGQPFDAVVVVCLALIARHYLNKELEAL